MKRQREEETDRQTEKIQTLSLHGTVKEIENSRQNVRQEKKKGGGDGQTDRKTSESCQQYQGETQVINDKQKSDSMLKTESNEAKYKSLLHKSDLLLHTIQGISKNK